MRTKFYTKKGDKGSTLLGKKKISKDNPFFYLLGGLDELNSWIGFCRTGVKNKSKLKDIAVWLFDIQEMLFIAQAELASVRSGFKPKVKITLEKIEKLEEIVLKIDKKIPPITKFVISGEGEESSRIDVGRAMARHVERLAKNYAGQEKISLEFLQFLNRLSSALFALARYVNWKLKIKEKHPRYR
ncbi:MAG: cob(I)yrinic acid a,c-diamide adenosyltransferase [bacterium]|nr:cob(I)yrinic acid a,c-diamide adenosyltransferase [bacterium]